MFLKTLRARSMEGRTVRQSFIGIALSLGLACAAQAGSFVVNSTRVTLSASQTVSTISVRNDGSEPSVVQVETAAWSQKDGVDVLTKTQALLATPSSFTIPPGGSQLVRVELRAAADPQSEITYRLFVREVPGAQPVAQRSRAAMRTSLPVFVVPPASLAPKLQWRATRREDGRIRLQARNAGSAHVEIAQVSITSLFGEKQVGAQKLAAYVLPDNSRQWMMKTESALPVGTMLRVVAQTDAGDMSSDIVLESDSAMAPAESVVAATDAHR